MSTVESTPLDGAGLRPQPRLDSGSDQGMDQGSRQTSKRWALGWAPAAGALALVWLAIGLLYRDTLTVMVGVWSSSETFTHGFLVPVISGWLVWRMRDQLRPLTPRPWPWMLVPMALLSLGWLAGDLMLVNAATQFALVGLIALAVPLVLGPTVGRAILFPLGFLLFAVPFGDFLMPVMMEHTADFTVAALQLTGIPVYREGLQFVIPSGNWSVVEACSGVRYLIASVMVGTLFAYLNYRAMWRRWVFVGVSIAVPIVANWLRAYMIVMLGHLSDNRIAVGVDHLIYGWVFFGIVIAAMFFVGGRWAEREDAEVPMAGAVAPGADAAGATGAVSPAAQWTSSIAAIVLCAVAPLAGTLMHGADLRAATPQLTLPATLGEFSRATTSAPGTGAAAMSWQPHFAAPRALASAQYDAGPTMATLHVAYFRGQDYKSKLVNSVHGFVKGEDSSWNVQNKPPLRARWHDNDAALDVVRISEPPRVAAGRSGMLLVARAYWIDGEFTTSPTRAKLLNAWARLRGRGDDGAVVMLALHGEAIADAALRAQLERVITPALAAVDTSLQAARERR